MVLHCPKCGAQHVDGDNWDELRIQAAESGRDLERWLEDNEWNNPPHRSHLCHGCGTIWRPADVPTTGVKAISTKGKADTWEPGQATPATVKTDAESIRSELFLIARKDQLTDRDRMIIGAAISVIASKQAARAKGGGA